MYVASHYIQWNNVQYVNMGAFLCSQSKQQTTTKALMMIDTKKMEMRRKTKADKGNSNNLDQIC